MITPPDILERIRREYPTVTNVKEYAAQFGLTPKQLRERANRVGVLRGAPWKKSERVVICDEPGKPRRVRMTVTGEDLTGRQFGHWTVTGYSHHVYYGRAQPKTVWNVVCKCGATSERVRSDLIDGKSRGCHPCTMKDRRVPCPDPEMLRSMIGHCSKREIMRRFGCRRAVLDRWLERLEITFVPPVRVRQAAKPKTYKPSAYKPRPKTYRPFKLPSVPKPVKVVAIALSKEEWLAKNQVTKCPKAYAWGSTSVGL